MVSTITRSIYLIINGFRYPFETHAHYYRDTQTTRSQTAADEGGFAHLRGQTCPNSNILCYRLLYALLVLANPSWRTKKPWLQIQHVASQLLLCFLACGPDFCSKYCKRYCVLLWPSHLLLPKHRIDASTQKELLQNCDLYIFSFPLWLRRLVLGCAIHVGSFRYSDLPKRLESAWFRKFSNFIGILCSFRSYVGSVDFVCALLLLAGMLGSEGVEKGVIWARREWRRDRENHRTVGAHEFRQLPFQSHARVRHLLRRLHRGRRDHTPSVQS